jgi:DNA-binding LacI/PurR family transcriptional regulator
MRDIARATDVSQSTVSRILSGAELAVPVAARTRERVLAAAAELGYRPNPLARALRGAPTMLMGAIVRDIRDPFFATAIDLLSLAARSHGYSVVLGHAREQADEALALAAILEARQCDAIVLIGDTGEQPQLLSDLAAVEIPVIELWQGSKAREFPLVGVDNRAGMRAALEHLAAQGHERIAFVGDPAKADIEERRAGWEAFMTQRTGGVPAGYDRRARNHSGAAAAALDALLALPAPPTAIAAATDLLAVGLLHAAHERGLAVPDELSVTGFDDIPFAAVTVPSLTTVRMPVQAMVNAAIDLAIGHARAGADRPPVATVFAPELVVRGSTGPGPAG